MGERMNLRKQMKHCDRVRQCKTVGDPSYLAAVSKGGEKARERDGEQNDDCSPACCANVGVCGAGGGAAVDAVLSATCFNCILVTFSADPDC